MLETAIIDGYMTKQGDTVFSMIKPSESINTLVTLANDVFSLVERFRGNEPVTTMNSYQLLARLLKEQCIVERVDTDTTRVSVKANKDVPSILCKTLPTLTPGMTVTREKATGIGRRKLRHLRGYQHRGLRRFSF